jgi:hypothetical protein
VAVHDVGRDSGHSYIVMELVEGTALSALMPQPAARALRMAVQVCEALAFAHQRGVVHGDVKPANVLVEPSGTVKLGDFGTARLVDAPARGLVAGTRAYMAPEALDGAPPDPRMDVFALGVVLHEMLTGSRPRDGRPSVNGRLGKVLERALAIDPAQRHPDGGALLDDLARVGQDGGAGLHATHGRWIAVGAAVNALLSVIALQALADSLAVVLDGILARVPALDTSIAAGGPLMAGLALTALAGLVTLTLDYRWQDADVAGGAGTLDRWLLPAAAVALLGAGLRVALPLGGMDAPLAVLQPASGLAQLGAAFGVWRELLDERRRGASLPARLTWRAAAALTIASFLCGLAALLA